MAIDLAIVIVNYKTGSMTADCLSSVYESLDGESLKAHVWVVDNASDDDSVPVLRTRFPQATLITSETNLGFAGGNNLALRAILARQEKPRLVLLLNSDTLVPSGALVTMVNYFDNHPNVGIVGPSLQYGDGAFQHSAFRFPTLAMAAFDFCPVPAMLRDSWPNGRYRRALYEKGTPFPIDHPLGAALMIRKEVIEEIGFLDESFFMYCEEIDWCLRARARGWSAFCIPSAVITHLEGRSAAPFRERMFVELWRSRFRLFRKHFGWLYRHLVAWIVRLGVGHEMRRIFRRIERGELTGQEAWRRLNALHQVRELARA